MNYPYQWIEDPVVENSITLAAINDIVAMKLAAITGRGTKKDFIDVYHLLHRISLPEMLRLYRTKYKDGSDFLVLKSLTYFGDAEADEHPNMFAATDWAQVKTTITRTVETFIQAL